MTFVPSGSLVDVLRGWLLHLLGLHALVSKQGRIAALDEVKSMAAQLSDSDLSVLDSWPLQFETTASPARPEDFTEATWDTIANFYARTGHWARYAGPDPMSRACKCPQAVLEKNNISLETCARGRFPLPECRQP